MRKAHDITPTTCTNCQRIPNNKKSTRIGKRIEVTNNIKSDFPKTFKVLDQWVLPSLVYGTEKWALNNNIVKSLLASQKALERHMLGITVQDQIRKTAIGERT